MTQSNESRKPVFIDAFAGCGGLSLGLMQAGWTGLFAIEKDTFAFETLRANLLPLNSQYHFNWPDWLPQKPLGIAEGITQYHKEFASLSGQIDMLVGGPPCQGYSSAGRRDPNDPRNQLFASYLDLVRLLKPKIVLLENVRGITIDFKKNDNIQGQINYSTELIDSLSEDYSVYSKMLLLSRFGVPQGRERFFLIGIRKNGTVQCDPSENPFDKIERNRFLFLGEKFLTDSISAKTAISDLEINRNGMIPSKDTHGFQELDYKGPITHYQILMNGITGTNLSDTRIARHRPDIAARFKEIIKICHANGRLNVSLNKETREMYGLKKQALRVLDPDRPSPTITSMPDDLLHYSEPRTLTVRENARLQSFPDWFVFHGKYTSGGHLRKIQIPRFTQVANAVPPLAAEAIGRSLLSYVSDSSESIPTSSTNASKLSR